VGAFVSQNLKFRYLREDLMSEGMVRTLDCIDRFLAGDVENLKAYLRLSIWSGCWQTVLNDDCVQSPRQCVARRAYDRPLGEYYQDERNTSPEAPVIAKDSVRFMSDGCCNDDIDRMILSMLISGKTLRKIAKELEISLSSVWTRKKKMGQRLTELMQD
jgi:DNA-directed RNA polymerase specialized sigma subunit